MLANFILFILLFISLSFVAIPTWSQYLWHLGQHQAYAVLGQVPLIEAKQLYAGDATKLKKIELIESVRDFGKKLYGLENSKSFEKFVPLDRKALGWNATLTKEFSLEPIEFTFPIAGSFDYIGFFSEKKMNEFLAVYKSKNYDVHISTIGAYSTLGYFNDPIFSTYLTSSNYWLVTLILHEMAHEKLFFSGDTIFSESLATFIEKKAALEYFKKQKINVKEISRKIIQKEYAVFWTIIEKHKQKLKTLYTKKMPDAKKRTQKKQILKNLRSALQKALPKMKHIYAPKNLLQKNINNATLIQTRRYTPHKSGFEKTFIKNCNKDFTCWFQELKKLESCSKQKRAPYLKNEISINEVLENCRS